MAEDQPACITIQDYRQGIIAAEDEEQREEMIQKGKETAVKVGMFVLGFIPGAGPIADVVGGGEFIKDLYDTIKDKDVELDDLDDFPVLKKLRMDKELVKALEDDILNDIDEKYLAYLDNLEPSTCIDQVPDINEFIRNYVAQLTSNHVVISDQSGGSV